MREENVTIASAGLHLAGVIRIPAGLQPGERRAAFLVLHGFGSNKNSQNVLVPCKVLDDLGDLALRHARLRRKRKRARAGDLSRAVEDTRNALTFLSRHPAVAPGQSKSMKMPN